MDSLVSFIVRLMTYIARFARWIPGIKYRRWSPGEPKSVLLVGYNGARNTGADVRVAALIDQIRRQADIGACELSITTLDEDSMKPYLDDSIAHAVNSFTRNSKAFVVIIGMEALDAAATHALRSRLEKPSALVLSKEHDGYSINSIISRLGLLITSRYHAALLACKNLVPSIAVSMDERLENLHFDAGFDQSLLCSVDDPALNEGIERAITYLHEHEREVLTQIQSFRERGLAHCEEMVDLFSDFLNENLQKESL